MHRAGGLTNILLILRKGPDGYLLNGRFGFNVNALTGFKNVNNSTVSRRPYMARAAQEPFLNGSSSVYVEEMYRAWVKDPTSVHKVISLQTFFDITIQLNVMLFLAHLTFHFILFHL